jgi:hypothetical protein
MRDKCLTDTRQMWDKWKTERFWKEWTPYKWVLYTVF